MKNDENRRILIVDDTESNHDDLKKILISSTAKSSQELENLERFLFDKEEEPENGERTAAQYEIDDAYSGEEAIRKVDEAEQGNSPYAVIYMDVRMPPGMNGIETIAKIWEKYPHIEMVICTAYSDYSWDRIVDTLGETDRLLFMKKPVNTVAVQQMTLSLVKKWNLFKENRYLIENLETEVEQRTKQINELLAKFKEANETLNKQNKILSNIAIRDSLTGLLNHAALHDNIEKVFSQASRHKFDLSLVMIDIDNFKELNDTYGHLFGDEVLVKVSEILREQFRPYDIKIKYYSEEETPEIIGENNHLSGRYGGDEFVLILPHCGMNEIDIVGNRLIDRIRRIKMKNHTEVCITASIGIAVLPNDVCCDDPKDLMALADQALYISKEEGRNRISVLKYPPEQ